jgi:hypothetical protein
VTAGPAAIIPDRGSYRLGAESRQAEIDALRREVARLRLYRLVHNSGCDFEDEIVGQEQPTTVIDASTGQERDAVCGCGAQSV